MPRRLTSRDWYDVADICEQAMGLCQRSDDPDDYTVAACDKASAWFGRLAMSATDNAMRAERRATNAAEMPSAEECELMGETGLAMLAGYEAASAAERGE